MEIRNAVIVDGVRSPFARATRGKLVATRLDELGAKIIRHLLDRNPKVTDHMIEDVGLGNVLGKAEFVDLGRVARLAGLPPEVSTFNSNRQCGSSMETLHRVAQSIMIGATDCGIALGAERMERTIPGEEGPFTRITEPTPVEFTKAQRDMAPDHYDNFSVPFPDFILDSPSKVSMLQTAQNVAEVYGLTRADLDEYAVPSHQKAVEAYEAGRFRDEIVPLEVEQPVFDDQGKWLPDERGGMITFDQDECIRAGTNFEALMNLNPIPGVVSYGGNEIVITPGNSSPTNDGVSAILVMSEEKALALGLEPLARIVGFGVAGVKPQLMGLGPVPATNKALRYAGLTIDQIDRVEFNEAFAAQIIPSARELGIPMEKLNVNGGALAIGHPLGATGARLVLSLAHELRRSNTDYGLATQCIGAGMGITTVLERI
ncbi:MAG: thiolase family protein [Chloroflexi bacterium]|nr:thiolase family protein [Chloroflexota bacterium]MDA1272215.1 thiolase family protein [Chloroflexota bacterium]